MNLFGRWHITFGRNALPAAMGVQQVRTVRTPISGNPIERLLGAPSRFEVQPSGVFGQQNRIVSSTQQINMIFDMKDTETGIERKAWTTGAIVRASTAPQPEMAVNAHWQPDGLALFGRAKTVDFVAVPGNEALRHTDTPHLRAACGGG